MVAWSIYRFDIGSGTLPETEVHSFARVLDPKTGTFVTDEFRIFSDVQSSIIERIEAVGDDGFIIAGRDNNAPLDQQNISVVIDLSDALEPPPPPLTILGSSI